MLDQQDTFVMDKHPARHLLPDLSAIEKLTYPDQLNLCEVLVDQNVKKNLGDRVAIFGDLRSFTYGELLQEVSVRSHYLASIGLLPGNRVLLRSPNNPNLVAWWLAIVRIGAIAVSTSPLLRLQELTGIADVAQPNLAIIDDRLSEEWKNLEGKIHTLYTYPEHSTKLRQSNNSHSQPIHTAAPTRSTDVAILAFTSGSTGKPKATIHTHRDLLAIADTYAKHILNPSKDDIFIGSPPIAFTFGLGALVIFPFRFGSSTVLIEDSKPDSLLKHIEKFEATRVFTAPTAYRSMSQTAARSSLQSLRSCISAGEALPIDTSKKWRQASGHDLLDGIGSTELLHIFISARAGELKLGTIGRVVPGYEARIVDSQIQEVEPGIVGYLAVKGPTGCRYFDDDRQQSYVREGWNITGDLFSVDKEGYFSFHGRADDLIISSGYNIVASEVEGALLSHPAVKEVAVSGVPDEERGQIVSAFVVVSEGTTPTDALAEQLKAHVKAIIAPYKYPRSVVFVDQLPKNANGKLQRFRLGNDIPIP